VSTDTRAAYKSFSDLRFAREPPVRPPRLDRPRARARYLHRRTFMQPYIRVSSDLHKHMPNVTTSRLRACMRLNPRTARSHPRQRLSRHIAARVRPSLRSRFKFSFVSTEKIIFIRYAYFSRNRVHTPGNVPRHIRAAYTTSPTHFHSNSPSCARPRLRTREVAHPYTGRFSITRHFNHPPEPPYTRLARRSLEDGSRSDTEKQGKAPRTVGKTRTWYALQTTLQQEEILGSARP